MSGVKKIKDKHKMAVDIYFTNGCNMTQALISAGFSESTAKRQCASFKHRPEVAAYMEEKRKMIESEQVAKQEELMKALTTIIRREQKDQVVLQDGTIVQYRVSTADQLKAIEKMMKIYGMDKVESNNQVNIELVYGEDPNDKKEAIEGEYIEL